MASLYNTSLVMSPADSMSSLSNLEKFMESASACTTPYNRSPTASPTHFPQQQQAATSCSNWQAALQQQQPECMSMMSGSESALYCNKQQQGGGGSMQGYLGSAPELLGSTMMSNDWQQLLDTNTRFASMRVVPPVSMQVQASTAGIMEGARIRELIARSGSLPSSQWGSMDAAGITVDPSKGGFALQGGAVGVGSMNAASSHCLAQFTSDPAFTERAATYSSFGAGKYSQIALPVTVENSSKPRGGPRSVEIGSNGKISQTSSLNLKKQQQGLAAVASSLEDNVGLKVLDVATGEVDVERNDEDDEEAPADDKSLPSAAAAAVIRVVQQQELEAVEGATETMSMGDHHHQMMLNHVEVEVAAAVAQDNSSCSEQQQQVGGRPGGSSGSPAGGAEPASLSPARSDDSGGAKKRKNSPPAAAGDIKADISYRDSKVSVPSTFYPALLKKNDPLTSASIMQMASSKTYFEVRWKQCSCVPGLACLTSLQTFNLVYSYPTNHRMQMHGYSQNTNFGVRWKKCSGVRVLLVLGARRPSIWLKINPQTSASRMQMASF